MRKVKKIIKNKTKKEAIKKIRIRVIGIGGGGSSIVSEISQRISQPRKISFVAANTDLQSLKGLPKIVKPFSFGQELTNGLGTGMNFQLAETAAQKEKERIKKLFSNQDLCFIIATLGGGAGSGASPVFSKILNEMGVTSYGIFTLPFEFEGKKKMEIAMSALEKLKTNLNAYSFIPNEKIFEIVSKETSMKAALSVINKKLAECLGSLIEMIDRPGLINIDFADVKTILSDSQKLAYLNAVESSGQNRAEEVTKKILQNPLYQYNISGAEKILYNISSSKNLKMSEVEKISKSISNFNKKAKIIFGISKSQKYKDRVKITLLATGCYLASEKKALPTGRQVLKTKKQKLQKKEQKKIKEKVKETVTTLQVQPSQPKEDQLKKEKKKAKVRKSALEIKGEQEELARKILQEEEKWEIPAFLRKKEKK